MYRIIECFINGQQHIRTTTTAKEITIIHYNFYSERNNVIIYESDDNFKTKKQITIEQLLKR